MSVVGKGGGGVEREREGSTYVVSVVCTTQ
jgi:hypothetical protein